MASLRLLTYSLATEIGSDSFDNFLSTIAYDPENGYFYFLLDFSIPKRFIGLNNPDATLSYQRTILDSMFGNVDEIPDSLAFNFECKCFAENNGIELIVFKPWCQNSKLSSQLLRTVETSFFVCIDIRIFLTIIRRALRLGKISLTDFPKTKVLNQIALENLYTFSLDHDNSLHYLQYYLDEKLDLEINRSLSSLTIPHLNQKLAEQGFKVSSFLQNFGLKVNRSQFVFELFNDGRTVGYISLSYRENMASPINFCKGFFIDYAFKDELDLRLFPTVCINISEFLGKYSTSLMLYFDNSENKFNSELFHRLSIELLGSDIYGLFIAKSYYEDIETEFNNTMFRDLILYGDPNEPPLLHF